MGFSPWHPSVRTEKAGDERGLYPLQRPTIGAELAAFSSGAFGEEPAAQRQGSSGPSQHLARLQGSPTCGTCRTGGQPLSRRVLPRAVTSMQSALRVFLLPLFALLGRGGELAPGCLSCVTVVLPAVFATNPGEHESALLGVSSASTLPRPNLP